MRRDALLLRRAPWRELGPAALVVVLGLGHIPTLGGDGSSLRYAASLVTVAAGIPLLLGICRHGARSARVAAGAALAFATLSLASAAVAVVPAAAIIGDIGRGTGAIFVAACAGAWAIGRSSSDAARASLRVALVAVATVNAVVAALQLVVDLEFAGLSLHAGRPSGLLGNPVHLSALAVAAIVVATAPRSDRLWTFAAAAGTCAAAVQLAGGRVGLVLTVAVVAARLWRSRGRASIVLAGSIVAGLAAGTLLASSTAETAVDRLLPTSASGSPAHRIETWKAAPAMVAERPLLGHGPGRFEAAAAPHRTERLGRDGPDRLFDDAHDLFVEYAVTTGLLGLAALVVFLGAAGRTARGDLAAAAASLLVVHLLQPLSMATTLTLFLLLGAGGPRVEPVSPSTAAVAIRRLLLTAAIAAGIVFTWGGSAYRRAGLSHDESAARRADAVFRWSPGPPAVTARIHTFRAHDTGAPSERAAAVRWRRVAVDRDPQQPALWFELADAQLTAGDPRSADTSARAGLAINPWSLRARLQLATSSLRMGRPAEARRWLDEAERLAPDDTRISRIRAAVDA